MASPIERLLAKLPDAKHAGKGWSARCPAHDDQRSSLSIDVGDDGRALLKCHAGCRVDAICAAVGLRVVDLMPTANKHSRDANSANGKPRIVAEYDYRDEAGKLLFQVLRFEPKDFRQRRSKLGGGWEWSVKGVRVVPYRLPDVLAEPNRPVFVVEGEKDADTLARIGLLATCNAGGAGKWRPEHSAFLRGRRVIILPDNDEAGRKHAQQVAQSLQGFAEAVRIVELPGLPDKGDVSDWLTAGGTRQELMRLVEAASPWTPAATPQLGPILTCMADVVARPISWLWPQRIPLGRITLVVGRPGEGKSLFTIDVAARVTTGTPWPDGSACPRGSVILISAEDDPADTIRPRLDAHHADLNKVHLLSAVRRSDDNGQYERLVTLADLDAIEEALTRLPDCKLIVVDPIGSFIGGRTDAHRDNEVRAVLTPIAMLAEKYGVAVLVVAHRRKSAGSSADDLALGSRAFTGIARAVWHLTRDTANKVRRLLVAGKNNLAPEGDGLAFRIISQPARVAWERDPVTMSADDVLAAENRNNHATKPGPQGEAVGEAVNWLRSALASGARPAKDVLDEWKQGEGGSKRTLDRARKALNVKAFRVEVPGAWSWKLPDKEATMPIDGELGDLGNLPGSTGISTNSGGVESKDAKLQELGNVVPAVAAKRVQVTI